MSTLINEITIHAPMDKIWEALSNIEMLERYDPTVEKSRAITHNKSGLGAVRKVDMKDGKNWFEEKCTAWAPNSALVYELTACSFPIQQLRHSYTFTKNGESVTVRQVMVYKVKFGLFGKFMDALMVRKQSDTGIKKFFAGLKDYTERK